MSFLLLPSSSQVPSSSKNAGTKAEPNSGYHRVMPVRGLKRRWKGFGDVKTTPTTLKNVKEVKEVKEVEAKEKKRKDKKKRRKVP